MNEIKYYFIFVFIIGGSFVYFLLVMLFEDFVVFFLVFMFFVYM